MAGFVCLYYGNTGSTWLLETLSTSPELLVPGFEPLEPWAWEAPDEVKASWMRTALTVPEDTSTNEALADWCEALSASPQFHGNHDRTGWWLTGWKMTWGAVDDPQVILDALGAAGAKAISLGRENRVKHALSLYRYHEEGKSQFDRQGERPPSSVSKKAMDRWLAESQRLHDEAFEFADRCRRVIGDENVLPLAYEEFVDDEGKEATLRKAAAFLGMDPAGIRRSRYQKATADDLRSALVNFDELRRAYRFSRYRRFFGD